MTYSRVGPREQGKRYSKGSRKPVKVRQAKVRYKHLKKKYKGLTGQSGGSLVFNKNLLSLFTWTHGRLYPRMGCLNYSALIIVER
jgi:hypothetical protein